MITVKAPERTTVINTEVDHTDGLSGTDADIRDASDDNATSNAQNGILTFLGDTLLEGVCIRLT